MDSMAAFAMGQAARAAGNKMMVFDWEKAAAILKERGAVDASAGLLGDYGYTEGRILAGGEPDLEDYTFLSSLWAQPMLIIGSEEIECWRFEDDSGWGSGTKWPDSALAILAAE